MQHGQHHFESTFVLLLVHIDRNTTTVVDNGYRIILVYNYLNIGGKAGKG